MVRRIVSLKIRKATQKDIDSIEAIYEEVDIVKCVFNGIPDVEPVCLEKYLQ